MLTYFTISVYKAFLIYVLQYKRMVENLLANFSTSLQHVVNDEIKYDFCIENHIKIGCKLSLHPFKQKYIFKFNYIN